MPQFDAMVTYSSLEHSGLGRYGDSLNPWGDLITMAQAWCLLKPGARALVGLPSEFFNCRMVVDTPTTGSSNGILLPKLF